MTPLLVILSIRIVFVMLQKNCLLHLLFMGFLISGCAIDTDLLDRAQTDIQFKYPAETLYTKNLSVPFQYELNLNIPQAEVKKSWIEVYEGEGCLKDGYLYSQTAQDPQSVTFDVSSLEDGKIYSAIVYVHVNTRIHKSGCSSWVGVDTQPPDSVTVQYPSGDNYTSQKAFTAQWTPSNDNGISGLAEKPYRIRLFRQAYCKGEVDKVAESKATSFYFQNLTHGVTYSVLVSSVDRAGNESPIACSPYTEIDVYAPGLSLKDPDAKPGFTKRSDPEVVIQNDSPAGYWCLTRDASFFPTSHIQACPGGGGSENGWSTTRPARVQLPASEGLYVYYLWLFRSDGSLVSNKQTSASIKYDYTPPSTFNVTGVQGEGDNALDPWLTSPEDGTPEVSWSPSTDAISYDLIIKDSTGSTVCTINDISAPVTTINLSPCPVLENGETYNLIVIAVDEAGNTTSAPPFEFTVDRTPPGPFEIQGLRTLADIFPDIFLGKGLPQVHFTSSANSSHYEVGVFDSTGLILYCPLVQFKGPATYFTFGALPENSCLPLEDNTEYLVKLRAMDSGLNSTRASNDEFRFRTDFTGPVANFTATAPLLSNIRDVEFVFEYSDVVSGIDKAECVIDGNSVANCLSPYPVSGLNEGTHNFLVHITDIAGNITSLTHQWVTDLSKPVSQWLSKPPAFHNSVNPSFSFSAVDTGGGAVKEFECSIDDGESEGCTSPLGLDLAPGSHSLKLRALDTAGNWGDWISWSWLIDTTVPEIDSLLGPSNPSHGVTNPAFTFTYHDEGGAGVDKVECSVDGGGFVVCSSPYSKTVAAGPHTMTLRVTDRSGNVAMQTYSWYLYTYNWYTSAYGACSASPYWSSWGAWGSCVSYSGCSGNQTRSRSCLGTSGTKTRTVYCERSDGVQVADAFCTTAKPATSTSCSVSCSGSSSEAQSCDACGVVGSASCSEYTCSNGDVGCGGSPECASTWNFSGKASSGGCTGGSSPINQVYGPVTGRLVGYQCYGVK